MGGLLHLMDEVRNTLLIDYKIKIFRDQGNF
jgi:hypothetical protein